MPNPEHHDTCNCVCTDIEPLIEQLEKMVRIAKKIDEAVNRVRELHKPFTYVWGGEIRSSNLCVECEDQDYPCDTIKALDGEL